MTPSTLVHHGQPEVGLVCSADGMGGVTALTCWQFRVIIHIGIFRPVDTHFELFFYTKVTVAACVGNVVRMNA